MKRNQMSQADFARLFDAVLAELNETPDGPNANPWRCNSIHDHQMATAIDTQGAEFGFSTEWDDGGRIVASGRFVRDYEPYPHVEYRVTVAASRGPAVIAREIQRRLLSRWLPKAHEALQRKRASDEWTANRNRFAAELAAESGLSVGKDDNANRFGSAKSSDVQISGKALSAERVSLEIDCGPATARVLLAALRTISNGDDAAKAALALAVMP